MKPVLYERYAITSDNVYDLVAAMRNLFRDKKITFITHLDVDSERNDLVYNVSASVIDVVPRVFDTHQGFDIQIVTREDGHEVYSFTNGSATPTGLCFFEHGVAITINPTSKRSRIQRHIYRFIAQ